MSNKLKDIPTVQVTEDGEVITSGNPDQELIMAVLGINDVIKNTSTKEVCEELNKKIENDT